MKKRICPRCRSRNLALSEIWQGHAIYWDKGFSLDDGIHSDGEPKSVQGICLDCRHFWTLRGVRQVDEEVLESIQ